MAETPQDRIARLERELGAARKTVDALIARMERQGTIDPDHFSILKAMAQLEEVITARERALARTESHFRVLWNECPDMLVTVDEDGDIRESNQAALRAGLKHRFADQFVDAELATGLLLGQTIEGELKLRDGRPVHVQGARLEDGLVLLVLRDLSLRRMLQEELNQARRLAVVGELASSVAHEINDPLAVILGRIELLMAVGEPNAVELSHSLEVILDHARRISLISRNLHVFGRPGLGAQRSVRVVDLVQGAQHHGGRRLKDVEVRLDIEPPELTVHGDPVQLEQVVVALLLHAADSMRRRGVIEVRARADAQHFHLDLRDRSSTALEEVQKALTEPWASRDGPDRKLMGMSVASSIVLAHGGRLRALQEGSSGCIYRITLPREGRLLEDPQRPLRILVVDPRPDGEQVVATLEEAGHQVRFATDGTGALASVERQHPDVILASPYVAGLGGASLRDALSRTHPELVARLVVLLGPGQEGAGGVRVLRKPFSALDLFEMLSVVAPALQ